MAVVCFIRRPETGSKTNTHQPETDLGYLLRKSPNRGVPALESEPEAPRQ